LKNLYFPDQKLAPSCKTPFLTRALDVTAAGFGLFLLWPIFLVLALAVKLTSNGPILYTGERVGKDGRLFKLYKFRSMYVDADRKGPGITIRDDPRITSVGRFLRRTKLDELPQLINILYGDMSLVGPRPEDPRYVVFYTPEQQQVLQVRPGLTSRASVYYRGEEALLVGDNWETIYREQILPRKLAAELAYLRQRTLWTDLHLIIRTVTTLLNGNRRMELFLEIRNRHFFLLDFLALLIIPALALSLRLDGFEWRSFYGPALFLFTAVALLIKLLIFYNLGLYHRYWRYANVNDLTRILIAVTISTIILSTLFISLHTVLGQYRLAMFRTVPVIDGLLTCLIISGFRLALRGLYNWRRQSQEVLGGRRVLVVGAGEAGTLVVREMQANPQLDMEPVAYIDDDPAKIGTRIQGLPVLGGSDDIIKVIDQHQIQRIVVAMPSAPYGRQREIITHCKQTGLTTHTLPGIYELLAGYKTISHLPQVDINRLLHREPVVTDQTEVMAALHGATVLVTGAGGSIGSELCRQIARYKPAQIILLGHGENSIFEIGLDLRLSYPNLVLHSVIADVRNQDRIEAVVEEYRPDAIFHAAAHKHVPFMQSEAYEALTNNVLGTRNVLGAAEKYGVRRFVLISSDKAVNPTSVMGVTKRMAELLVVAAAQRSKRPYMAVRFGNVLGSRGSVIPVFQRQIAAGGPVTITHPEMTRYFMTIPEAVQLVLQASVLGKGSEVFMLDMGQPVRIIDLATNLLNLSGLMPGRDIKIIYTGIRPGEKLSEELILDGEDYRRTKHPKIFMATPESVTEAAVLEQIVIELIRLVERLRARDAAEQIRPMLLKFCYYIDKYQPVSTAEPEVNDKPVVTSAPSSSSIYPQSSTSMA
jgi:FlaA1/EpsC-like NDP-sugar epimerase/lipopolysaccharide/colanic/teichoic acid biosynthesis glycosyltransferase